MAEVDPTNEQRSQLERLAEEYVHLHRLGKAPSIEEFVVANPELASDIRELFPVMLMLDQGQQTAACLGSDGAPTHESGAAPGSRLGDYKLGRVIGRGGMGLVYEADHLTLGNKVAIKLLPSSLNRPKLQERFLREASAAARMNHPNIVRVFDYGKQDTTHYYVMSLVEGVGLDRVLANSQVDVQAGPNLAATRVIGQYRGLVASSLCHSLSHPEESPACHSEDTPATDESSLLRSTSPPNP